MYYQVIAQCTQSLKNLETCLDKADRYAANKKFDAGVLMSSRLARAFWSAESPAAHTFRRQTGRRLHPGGAQVPVKAKMLITSQ